MKLDGRIGIDSMANLKTTIAGAVHDLVRKVDIKRLHAFAESELELVELTVGKNSDIAGVAVKALGLPRQILIAFLIHNGKTIIPNGETVLNTGDTVGVVLPKSQIERIKSRFGV
ncbi:MAG: TrkA C-terminal domain-containing protein [Rectinemataceae bacterium]|nr:TrkA C-terminal domain-containing protein [Rectinemataceae bacterium]